MTNSRYIVRTAFALLLALAMVATFLSIIIFTPRAFAQETHAQFWNAEAARVAKPMRRTSAPSGAPLLNVASRYVGGRNPTGTRGPWCRDFVNHVVRKAGYRLADSSRKARDAVRLGRRVSSPRPGDLAVMRSHVTIVAGFEAGRVVGLGGNQCGGRVCVSRYAQGRVIAFIRVGA